nr:retron system putative HNH endonuclease [uncultured Bacteroides sp.]
MRYIKKRVGSEAAELLKTWIKRRKAAGQNLLYVDFDKKKELNDNLRSEQKGICCYCQQKITHYQGDNNGGSHNEHLIPENGEYGRQDLQVVHHNLYASCNYSKGKCKGDQHCGEAKHDKLIAAFIKRIDCDKYFKYNVIGEILPSGPYNSHQEYEEHYGDLTNDQRDAYDTIQTLNLNHESIKQLRKGDQKELFKILGGKTREQVRTYIQTINTKDQYPRFIDMLLYYMKQKQ